MGRVNFPRGLREAALCACVALLAHSAAWVLDTSDKVDMSAMHVPDSAHLPNISDATARRPLRPPPPPPFAPRLCPPSSCDSSATPGRNDGC